MPCLKITEADKIGDRVSLRGILRVVAEAHGITLNEILSARRNVKIVRARQHAWEAIAFYRWDLTLSAIGKRTGGKDHSTVLHGIRKFKTLRPQFAREISIVDKALEQFAEPAIDGR